MKRILFLLLLLAAFTANAQPWGPLASSYSRQYGIWGTRAAVIPRDTTYNSTEGGIAIVNGRIMIRNAIGWVYPVSGVAGIAADNGLYLDDTTIKMGGVFSENTELDANSFYFSVINASEIGFSTVDGGTMTFNNSISFNAPDDVTTTSSGGGNYLYGQSIGLRLNNLSNYININQDSISLRTTGTFRIRDASNGSASAGYVWTLTDPGTGAGEWAAAGGGATNAFVQDGNAFGEDAIFGTTDGYNLYAIVGSVNRMGIFDNGGIAFFGPSGSYLQFIGATGNNTYYSEGSTSGVYSNRLEIASGNDTTSVRIYANGVGSYLSFDGGSYYTGSGLRFYNGVMQFKNDAEDWQNIGSGGGATDAFVQNGNAFGTTAVIGTTDNYGVTISVNNQARFDVANNGDFNFLNADGETLASITNDGELFFQSKNSSNIFKERLHINAITDTAVLRFFDNDFGYMNFNVGEPDSYAGYGFRDSSGVVQIKNKAGVWGNIPNTRTLNIWEAPQIFTDNAVARFGKFIIQGTTLGGIRLNYDDGGSVATNELNFRFTAGGDYVAYESWVTNQLSDYKLNADSILTTGYMSRGRGYKAIDSLAALMVNIAGNQTITGIKTFNNDMYVANGNFLVSNTAAGNLTFRNINAGQSSVLRIQTADKDGTDAVMFNFDVVGYPGDANRETGLLGYNTTLAAYVFSDFRSGTGKTRPIRFGHTTTPTAIVIDTLNNVGIGTATPVSMLHVSDGNSVNSNLYSAGDLVNVSAVNTAPGFNLISASTGTAGNRGVFKATRSRGTLSSPTAVGINDMVFSLIGAAYDGTAARSTAAITMFVDGAVSTGNAPQAIIFETGAGSSRSEQWRISSVGTLSNTGATGTSYFHLKAGSATANTNPQKFTSGPLNTTAEAGAVEFNNSFYLTKASGLRFANGGAIFDAYTDAQNSGTGETDIFSYTCPASTLAANGEKINFRYTLNLTDITATAQIQVYFGGNVIGNTGALTVSATGAIVVEGWIVRTGSSTARASISISSPTASTAAYTAQTDITGLTFTNTQILKVTATAGGAGGGTGDIVGKMAVANWFGPAAN